MFGRALQTTPALKTVIQFWSFYPRYQLKTVMRILWASNHHNFRVIGTRRRVRLYLRRKLIGAQHFAYNESLLLRV